MPKSILRPALIQTVFQLRRNTFSYESLSKPQSVGLDVVSTPGGSQRRCRVILTAHGCCVATCTMCPLPDEAVAAGVKVTTAHWLQQLSSAFDGAEPVDILTLFHNGNFFADKEVPRERREAVYAWLRTTGVHTLVVESLPQFVTKEKLAHAALHLGPGIRLEVAIGLQSTHTYLRETVLASPCTQRGFTTALAALREQNYGVQVFLMHQMPFLTPEESSVALLESIVALHTQYGIEDPTVCALRLAPATVAHTLYQQGKLELGSLWHLLDVLWRVRQVLPGSRARVAVSCLQPSTPQSPSTDVCPQCRPRVMQWLADFNQQRDGPLPERCACAPAALSTHSQYQQDTVAQRIEQFLTAK